MQSTEMINNQIVTENGLLKEIFPGLHVKKSPRKESHQDKKMTSEVHCKKLKKRRKMKENVTSTKTKAQKMEHM